MLANFVSHLSIFITKRNDQKYHMLKFVSLRTKNPDLFKRKKGIIYGYISNFANGLMD